MTSITALGQNIGLTQVKIDSWFMHLNIEGIFTKKCNKFNDLELMLESSSVNISVISLNEHWVTRDNVHLLDTLNGFVMADCHARSAVARGGSCILVKEGIDFKIRDDFCKFKEDFVFEGSFVEIVKNNLLFISI